MLGLGFINVQNIAGGITAWVQDGYQVTAPTNYRINNYVTDGHHNGNKHTPNNYQGAIDEWFTASGINKRHYSHSRGTTPD